MIKKSYFKKTLIWNYKLIRFIFGWLNLGNINFIKRINTNFLRYVTPNFIILNGHKMFLDPLDSLRLSIYGIHEVNEKIIYKNNIKKGDIVIDIGANIGYDTLILAELVGKNGKVIAFEPYLNNFKLLQENIKINGYNNVILVNKAVSNKNGKIKLYLDNDKDTGHKIYDNDMFGNKLNRNFVYVDTIRLDDYLMQNKIYKIDFVKIDVEGAECEVIKGMKRVLSSKNSLKMILEFIPSAFINHLETPIDTLLDLKSKGFKIYDIPEKKHFNRNDTKIENNNDMIELINKWNKLGTNLFCEK